MLIGQLYIIWKNRVYLQSKQPENNCELNFNRRKKKKTETVLTL